MEPKNSLTPAETNYKMTMKLETQGGGMEKAMNGNMGSLELMKRINRQLVLEQIKKEQPVSRARLARQLALSKTTVGAICDELLASHMIVDLGEKGPEKGSGRPAKMLGFNPLSAYGVGIDLHPDRALAVVTDLDGSILYRTQSPALRKPVDMAEMTWHCARKAGIPLEDVAALGVSVPGTVDRNGMVRRANSLGWQEYDLQKVLKQLLPCRVVVNNEANCAALGERWRGSACQVDNLYYIAIGEGIGSAMICDGSLIYGACSRAGEIGYFLSPQDAVQGLRNELGSPGVFEYKLQRLLQGGGLGPEQTIAAYVRGEEPACSMVEQFIQNLSWVIANLVCVLNPEVVVIGGASASHLGPIIPAVRAVASSLTPVRADVILGTLGQWASAVGAVAGAICGSAGRPRLPLIGG